MKTCEPIFGGLICGALLTVLVMAACAALERNARVGTVDHNRVGMTAEAKAQVEAEVEARVSAALASFETRIGSIEASLVGPVSLGPIGGTHAGGDVATMDSWTSLILAAGYALTLLTAIPSGGLFYLKVLRPRRLKREAMEGQRSSLSLLETSRRHDAR